MLGIPAELIQLDGLHFKENVTLLHVYPCFLEGLGNPYFLIIYNNCKFLEVI